MKKPGIFARCSKWNCFKPSAVAEVSLLLHAVLFNSCAPEALLILLKVLQDVFVVSTIQPHKDADTNNLDEQRTGSGSHEVVHIEVYLQNAVNGAHIWLSYSSFEFLG